MKITSRSFSDSSFYDTKIVYENHGAGSNRYMVYRLFEKKSDLNVGYEITASFDNVLENYKLYSKSCKIGDFTVKGSVIDFNSLEWGTLSQYIDQINYFSFIVDSSNTMFVVVKYYVSSATVNVDGQNLKLMSSGALSQKLLVDDTVYLGNLMVDQEKISKEAQLTTSDKTVTLSTDDSKVRQILNFNSYSPLTVYKVEHLPGSSTYEGAEEPMIIWSELQQELFDTFSIASSASNLGKLFKIQFEVKWNIGVSNTGTCTYYIDHEDRSRKCYIKDLKKSSTGTMWPTSKFGNLEECFNKIYITFSDNGLINNLVIDDDEEEWKTKVARIVGPSGTFMIGVTHKFEPYFGSTSAEGDKIEFKVSSNNTVAIERGEEAAIDYKGTKLYVSFKSGLISISSYYRGYFYPLDNFYNFTITSEAIPFYTIDVPTKFNYPILSSYKIKEDGEYANYTVVAIVGNTIQIYPKNEKRTIGAYVIAILP